MAGAVHPGSDVDLGVVLERPRLTLEEHAGLVHELQRLVPDREVDLAVLNHADPLFLKKVTENCRLLYGAPADLQRLKLHAFKRYHDYRRYLDLERRFVARALARPAAGARPGSRHPILAERYLERMIGRMIACGGSTTAWTGPRRATELSSLAASVRPSARDSRAMTPSARHAAAASTVTR